MKPPLPEPASQSLVATVLILLTALALIFFVKDLARRPAGESRIGWPPPVTTKP